MVRTTMRATLALAALSFVGAWGAATAEAAHPDLFYNFYASRNVACAVQPVQLYVAPLPTPPMVGHTFITYPPLMPHEFMYHHHRTYYKYYHNGGWSTAHVRYH